VKLRKRDIIPSIVLNSDLPELGPHATILWVFLPMLADREGRLEDHPKKIKAKLLPHPQYADVDVEGILDALAAKGMLRRYLGEYVVENITEKSGIPLDTHGPVKIIQIVTFLRHQKRLHPEEPKSYFSAPPSAAVSPSPTRRKQTKSQPPPKRSPTVNGTISERARVDVVSTAMNIVSRVEVLSTASSIQRTDRTRAREKLRSVGKPPSENPARKPPAPDTNRPVELPPRKPPAQAIDWGFYQPDQVTAVREMIRQVGQPYGLPPPDDRLVRRALDVCGGASVDEIYQALRALCRARRFEGMRSWGLMPMVLAGVFRTRERTG
jgi:hypothetical protein